MLIGMTVLAMFVWRNRDTHMSQGDLLHVQNEFSSLRYANHFLPLANAIECGINPDICQELPHPRPYPNPHYLPPTLSCPMMSRFVCLNRVVALRYHMYTAHPHFATKDNSTPVRSILPSVKELKYQTLKHFTRLLNQTVAVGIVGNRTWHVGAVKGARTWRKQPFAVRGTITVIIR
jgi:hypothetical protein